MIRKLTDTEYEFVGEDAKDFYPSHIKIADQAICVVIGKIACVWFTKNTNLRAVDNLTRPFRKLYPQEPPDLQDWIITIADDVLQMSYSPRLEYHELVLLRKALRYYNQNRPYPVEDDPEDINSCFASLEKAIKHAL